MLHKGSFTLTLVLAAYTGAQKFTCI